jgi:hypothetical protein
MEPTRKLTPKFFFLSLGVLAGLIASASAFLSLIFATLDKVFPDVLTATYQYGYASYSYESMRSALAILIIVFPVFVLLSVFWHRAAEKEIAHWDDILRRWVVYLILFLASVLVVVDLVTLVRYFVSGEITIRFILKVAIVLSTGALVGWYYLLHLRTTGPTKRQHMLALTKGIIFALGSIIWAFVVMGGPGAQRDLRLDQRRVEDLQSLQSQIIMVWQQKEKLPETLDELKNPIANYMAPQDPEFQKGKVYEYKKLSAMKFELCATFIAPIPKGYVENSRGGVFPTKDIAVSSMPYPGGGLNDSWGHQEGRTCFERTIDPEIYPPYPKVKGV